MQSVVLKDFEEKKARNKELLEKLLKFLQEGVSLGVDIDSSYITKVESALKEVGNTRLKVALVGGFSEGKTSIAAAWLERLKEEMKINVSESSDSISVFNVGDDLEIIDTPGLFGYKAKNLDSGKIQAYKDITKEYISNSNILLYVLNPSNPIQESHKDNLHWLFRELGLLSRTIFVLGKFDTIVDIKDKDEYNEALSIKKKTIINRLKESINLTQSEIDSITIVAVSANPFDRGIEYWLNNINEFRELSHIKSLQDATKKKIDENGGTLAIIESTKHSIIQDVVHKELPLAEKNFEIISEEIEKLDKVAKNTSKDLKRLNSDIETARRNLNDFAMRYFDGLVVDVKGLSLETFQDFYDKEIGNKGINIKTRVQNKFSEETEHIYTELNNIAINFDTEIKRFESDIEKLGKQGIKFLQSSKIINAQNVKLVRDGIVSAGKIVGLDLGKYLKFQPWGAVKLAGTIGAVLSVLSMLLEIWDTYKRKEAEDKLQEAKKELANALIAQKEEMLNLVNSPEFKATFFQFALTLESNLNDIESTLKEQDSKKQKMLTWLHSAQSLR